MLIILLIILALYLRTIRYNYIIDDYCTRSQYPLPAKESYNGKGVSFFTTRPTVWYRLFMIGTHCVNTFLIYTLWGWAPALLFAVHPMAIWGTAWCTGNYYATTTLFTLVSYYFLVTFPNWWGAGIATVFYTAALNSTFDAILFPFLTMFIPWGWVMFAPLAIFLNGKKFRTGLKSRTDLVKGSKVETTRFELKRIVYMTKVIARYTYTTLVPMRIYMFSLWGERMRNKQCDWDSYHAMNKEFWASLALILSVFLSGLIICPAGIWWFFILIFVHSHFQVIGQTFAQRYLYLPMIGLCVVAGTLLSPYPLVVIAVAGWLACKTHNAIPGFKNMVEFFENDIRENPDRGLCYSSYAQFLIASGGHLYTRPPEVINYISYLIRKSVRLSPDEWKIFLNYSTYLTKIGRLDEAIVAADKTIALLKEYGSAFDGPIFDSLQKQRDEIGRIRDMALQMEKDERIIL